MHPRREQVVLLHALMKLGAVACPLNPRLTEAERAAELAAERPALDLGTADELTKTEADLPLLGEHDLDAVHCRILTSGTSGRAASGRRSPTATTCGAPWAPLQHRRRARGTAGSAACPSATSPGSRSSCAR